MRSFVAMNIIAGCFFSCASTISASETDVRDVPNPFKDKNLKQTCYGIGNYLQYADAVDPSEINLIVEVGSRDAIDAIQLGYYYKCPVYAFECHPIALNLCYEHVKNYPYVTIVPCACWNKTGVLPFYSVVESHGGAYPVNIGGSSLLVARPDGADRFHVQGAPIPVNAVRLDAWLRDQRIHEVSLLCMDCQGATLQVLEGLGEALRNVKYIISEVYFTPSFEGEALFPEIKLFLESNGFTPSRVPQDVPFGDVLFVNKKLLRRDARS